MLGSTWDPNHLIKSVQVKYTSTWLFTKFRPCMVTLVEEQHILLKQQLTYQPNAFITPYLSVKEQPF